MATIFSETLLRLRKEAGFPTAYRFFYDNGGDKVLGICYRKYLLMEKGNILPLFKHLRGFILGLHLELNSSRGRELVTAWLKTMAGEEIFEEMLKPMLQQASQGGPGLSPMHKAMEKSLAGGSYHVKPEEVAVIASSPANFRCFLAMSNDLGTWTPEQLAPLLQLSLAETRKALSGLAGAKLLKEKKGSYTCPLANGMLIFPHMGGTLKEDYARIKKYQESMLSGGKLLWSRSLFIRADKTNIPNLLELLGGTVAGANGYSVTEKRDSTSLFSIDASVTRLLDF